MGTEFWLVVQWWVILFLFGLAAWPLTQTLFNGWWDKGYLFSKAVGLVVVSYTIWFGASIHILPFTSPVILLVLASVFVVSALACGWIGAFTVKDADGRRSLQLSLDVAPGLFKSFTWDNVKIYIFAEALFLAALLFWSYVKGHEPSIRGLEKFMDFGFAKSIQTNTFFPPSDMWYSGLTINYYYFGHFVMAMLSKFSGVDLRYGFNLMLASLFAFTCTMSFSIGYELVVSSLKLPPTRYKLLALIAGLFTAFLMSFAGNMQTLYAFTKGYTGENVKPFWELMWSPEEFPTRYKEGMNTYWYANATRFIPYTIHEFPSYSFVVSDVHGHVLSLPFVLLAIALLLQIFGRQKAHTENFLYPLFYGLLVAVLFMTNVLDAPIYMGLFVVLSFLLFSPTIFRVGGWFGTHGLFTVLAFVTGPLILPFVTNFKSFVNGVAVNCPPAGMADQKIGILLFETVDKCQKSPIWMMYLLWGFFIYTGIWFMFTVHGSRFKEWFHRFTPMEKVLLVMFVYSIGLIIFPEFFYFKDIYPQHFRSNTMFKLGYQAYIMFTILSGYAIVKIISLNSPSVWKKVFIVLLIPHLFFVAIYPNFSIKSYFGKLGNYKTLDGLAWLKDQYPDDYEAVMWMDRKIQDKQLPGVPAIASVKSPPVIVEADGDSYTDYNRVSAYTGAPAVIGWAVHEWLWHGTYDVVAPRRDDVSRIYTDPDIAMTQKILAKYDVSYIIVGTIERQKYANILEDKLKTLGTVVFESGDTYIIKIEDRLYNSSPVSY